MKKKKIVQTGAPVREEIPIYLRDSLPDQRSMPAKMLVANMPENIERPNAEDLDILVKQLYKGYAATRQKKQARRDGRKRRAMLKKKQQNPDVAEEMSGVTTCMTEVEEQPDDAQILEDAGNSAILQRMTFDEKLRFIKLCAHRDAETSESEYIELFGNFRSDSQKPKEDVDE